MLRYQPPADGPPAAMKPDETRALSGKNTQSVLFFRNIQARDFKTKKQREAAVKYVAKEPMP